MENIRKQAEAEATIIDNYIANENTYMLSPVRGIDYYSIALEKDAIYYVKQTPLEIIDYSCEILDWTSYEGRREVIAEELNFPYKTPIPISLIKKIIAFPTMCPTHYKCCWIFQHPDINIGEISHQGALFIHLEQKVILDVSYNNLEDQFKKGAHLKNFVLFRR